MTRYQFYDPIDTNILPDFNDLLMQHVFRKIEAENSRIEADLLTLPGVHPGLTAGEALTLGLEVAFQRRPEGGVQEYRGIRQDREWVIDHHPEWGEVFDPK